MTRRGNWFLSTKGRQIYPMDLRPEDVDIEEIAHALGNICRFGGHVPSGFYSVGQHSVHVAQVLPPHLRLVGLLHDATEAYCGDMVRPIKHMPEMAPYREMEDAIWLAIADRFSLPLELPAAVKEADARMLQTERRDLLAPHHWKWSEAQADPAYPTPYADFRIAVRWGPGEAEREYLACFEREFSALSWGEV